MTIEEMHSWFDILQMKGNSIEFTRREKDHIINRAQIKFVNEALYKVFLPSVRQTEREEQVFSSIESNITGEEMLAPLIIPGTELELQASATGNINYTQMGTAIDTWLSTEHSAYSSTFYNASTDIQSEVMMILGIDFTQYWDGSTMVALVNPIPVRYMKNFDWRKASSNVYRKADNKQPIYYIRNNSVRLQPSAALASGMFEISLIKKPRPVIYSGVNSVIAIASNIDCELPDFTHDEIMSIALDDAGVATRDQALIQLNAANKENLTTSTV